MCFAHSCLPIGKTLPLDPAINSCNFLWSELGSLLNPTIFLKEENGVIRDSPWNGFSTLFRESSWWCIWSVTKVCYLILIRKKVCCLTPLFSWWNKHSWRAPLIKILELDTSFHRLRALGCYLWMVLVRKIYTRPKFGSNVALVLPYVRTFANSHVEQGQSFVNK